MAVSDASIRQLQLQISASTELLVRNLKTADASIVQFRQQTDRNLDQIDNRFLKLGESIGSTIRGAIGGALASIAAISLGDLAKDGLEYASSLGEVADSLGVSTDFLQKFRFAASQTGGSIQGADNAIGKFAVTVGKALDGNKAAAAAFRNLNIELEDSRGHARPLEALYEDVADAISKLPDPARQAADAQNFFGKGAREIIPLLKEGADGFRQLAADASALGLILDRELIDKADNAADRLAALKNVLSVKIAGVVAENADAILTLANAFATMATNAGNAIIATRNFFAIRSFNGGTNSGAALDLSKTASGRQALLNEIDAKIEQNQRDRSQNRGGRTSYAGGLFEVTRQADAADQARLDRDFKALVRQRNAILAIDKSAAAAATADPVRVRTGGGAGGGAGGSPKGSSSGASAGPKPKSLADRIKEDYDLDGSSLNISAPLAAAGSEANALKVDLSGVGSELDAIGATLPNIDIGSILSEDEQRRLEYFTESFNRDLTSGLADAIAYGDSLGDALENSIKRAAATLLESGLMDLLSGASFGSSFGAGGIGGVVKGIFGGAFADGGSPPVGKVSLVGERGPELFVPKVPGTVVPNHVLGGGRTQVETTVKIEPSPLFATSVDQRVAAGVGQAAEPIMAGAEIRTRKALNRPSLPGGYG